MTSFCDIYVFDAPTNHPAPLYQQCFQYILMNLEQFPIASLALLPLKIRWNLLWNLPLADVCQLEITQFTSGMCMEKYWQTIVHIAHRCRRAGGSLGVHRLYAKEGAVQPMQVEGNGGGDYCQGVGVFSDSSRSHHRERSHTGTAPKQRLLRYCFILNGGHNATNPKH